MYKIYKRQFKEKADYKYYSDKLDEETYNKLIALDPSKKKNFEVWIVNGYLKLNDRAKKRFLEEDSYKLVEALTLYIKGQSAGITKNPYNNIKAFETYKDLFAYLKDNKLQFNQFMKQDENKDESGLIPGKDYVMLYKDKDWTIVDTLTWKANCYFGSNTSWCTTDPKSSSTFEGYKEKSPLVVIIHEGSRYQIHESSQQYMDEKDHPFDIISLAREMPRKAQSILYKKGFHAFNPEYVRIFEKLQKCNTQQLRDIFKKLDIDERDIFSYIKESDKKYITNHLDSKFFKWALSDYLYEYNYDYLLPDHLPNWEENPSKYIDEEPKLNPGDPDGLDSYDEEQQQKIEDNYQKEEDNHVDYQITSAFLEMDYFNTSSYRIDTYINIFKLYIDLLLEPTNAEMTEIARTELLYLIEVIRMESAKQSDNVGDYLGDVVRAYNSVIETKKV
jgi:hypothetical protein